MVFIILFILFILCVLSLPFDRGEPYPTLEEEFYGHDGMTQRRLKIKRAKERRRRKKRLKEDSK